MKLHFPQEFSEMKERYMPSTLNHLHTSNDGSQTQAGTVTIDIDVVNGKSNHQFTGIHNNLVCKEKSSANCDSKRSEFLLTNCSKCMCSIHKTNRAEQLRCTCSVLHDSRKYKPPARKGTQYPFILSDKSLLNCTDQYVTSERGKENHLYFSDTCERDNGNQVTNISNAESALEGASNDRMSIDCDITAIVKEVEVPSPVSNLDDSFSYTSDMTENIPSCELDCSVMSEDVRTDVQKAADVNSRNKDGTQFKPDARGTSTPCAALEADSSIVCARTKKTYDLETVSAIGSLDDHYSEISNIIEDIPSSELDYSFMLEDVRSEILKASYGNNHNKDSTWFISDTTGTLTPFAACMDGSSSMFLNTRENEKLNSKELRYGWHTEGQNFSVEENVDVRDAEGVTVHHSLQEASTHFMDPLTWTPQFF
jgi:hypothetical protein